MSIDPFSLLAPGAVRQAGYAQGDTVFAQGKATGGVFRVRSGAVAMRRVTPDGDTVLVRKAVTGEVFAEASLFTSRYHCDAVCVQDSVIEKVSKKAVLDALGNDPAFALAFCALMAHSIHHARQLIELVALSSAEERVLAALQLGLLTGTISELAERIGLTQATCYRALNALAGAGRVVKVGRGQYRLPHAP